MKNAISSLLNLSCYFIARFVLGKDKEELSSISKQVMSSTNIFKVLFKHVIDFSVMHILKLKTGERNLLTKYFVIQLICYLLIMFASI